MYFCIRYKKLAKYLADESIPLNAILNRRGEKLIHVAAKEGAASCLEVGRVYNIL